MVVAVAAVIVAAFFAPLPHVSLFNRLVTPSKKPTATSAPATVPRGIEPTPNPTGALASYLSAVSCASATACTALGGYTSSADTNLTLAEAWNGKTWTIEPTATPKGASLSSVSCTSATACTAVGGGLGGTLAEAWNGKTWAIEPTPNPTGARSSDLVAVSCTSATACTAVGDSVEQAGRGTQASLGLAEAWNGKRWAIEPTPTSYGASLSAVSCTSATACTALGGGPGAPLAEAWNGKTWALEFTPSPNGESLSGVSCTSATACTAVGGGGLGGTLAEAWNGKRWAIEPTPTSYGASLSAVSCTSATACTAVGDDTNFVTGVTLAETWNGKTWAIEPTPDPTRAQYSGLGGVSCTSAEACTAVGDYDDSADIEVTLAEAWNRKT
jgi:hypothetical protein